MSTVRLDINGQVAVIPRKEVVEVEMAIYDKLPPAERRLVQQQNTTLIANSAWGLQRMQELWSKYYVHRPS